MLLPAFHLACRPVHRNVGPRAPSRAKLQSGKDAKEPVVGDEQLGDTDHPATFVMSSCLRSSSCVGGLMTWASVSRLLGRYAGRTQQSISFSRVIATTLPLLHAVAGVGRRWPPTPPRTAGRWEMWKGTSRNRG